MMLLSVENQGTVTNLPLTDEQVFMVMQVAMVLVVLVTIYLLARLIEKVVSRSLPEKQCQALIQRLSRSQAANRRARIQIEKNKNGATVKTVRTVFMPKGDYEEGQEGTFYLRGRYVMRFEPKPREEDIKQDRYYRYPRNHK